MNLKEIKELITLMNENDLMELEIEREGIKIRLKKTSSGTIEHITEERIVSPRPQIVPKEEAYALQKPEKNLDAIKAPMVGTFYRTPAPDAKPYVEIGQIIEVGQIVCIIEAMKLMNEIKSEIKGRIVEILVENGRPIEYGQPLFMIEPA